MVDATEKSLYTVSLNDDAEKRQFDANGGTFEYDFTFLEDQIVKFPVSMGVTGFVYAADAVVYKNECSKIFGIKKAYGDLYMCGDQKVPLQYRASSAKLLGGNPFNERVDNFVEVQKVYNLAFCSLQDEEFGRRAFGTL